MFLCAYPVLHLLCQSVVFQYNERRFGENPEEKPYIFLNRYHSRHYRRVHFYKIWIFYILSSSIDVPAPGILRMYSSPSQENKKTDLSYLFYFRYVTFLCFRQIHNNRNSVSHIHIKSYKPLQFIYYPLYHIFNSPYISPVVIFFFYFAFFIHLYLSFYAQICYA